jgi:hypothetical protein
MTRWTSVDQPVTQTERRRVRYEPYRTHAFDDHSHDPSVGPALRLVLVIAGALGLIVAMGLGLTGCITTELQTDRVTMTRTSVLSDVEVEATMAADGSILVRERQGQAVAEGLVGAVPVVTP